MSTVNPQAALRAETQAKLSKYGTPQILTKLRSGAFFKLSKEVALEILTKRKVDISEFEDVAVKAIKISASHVIDVPTEKIVKLDKIEAKIPNDKKKKELIEKVKNITVRKTTSVFVAIDETDLKVFKIFNSPIEETKTSKIEALLKLGYSANQISKSSLNAHYSFCLTVKGKMNAKGEGK